MKLSSETNKRRSLKRQRRESEAAVGSSLGHRQCNKGLGQSVYSNT